MSTSITTLPSLAATLELLTLLADEEDSDDEDSDEEDSDDDSDEEDMIDEDEALDGVDAGLEDWGELLVVGVEPPPPPPPQAISVELIRESMRSCWIFFIAGVSLV
ncbi:hypothetical protein [Cellvibrio japonicus]|nr:hypothetical protein [Cellvibrio japonicus]